MKVTIIPNKPITDAAVMELLLEIAKAFVDLNEGELENELDLSDLSKGVSGQTA